jgi:hypothetical protein
MTRLTKTDKLAYGNVVYSKELKIAFFGTFLVVVVLLSLLNNTFAYTRQLGIQTMNARIMEPKIEVFGLHTVPNIVRVNDTFYINATILNNSTNNIKLDFLGCGGSPLSAVFDKNVKIEQRFCNIMFNGHTTELAPQHAVTISGPDYLTEYRAIKSGSTTANVTLNYGILDNSSNDGALKASKSKTFTFNICLCLPPIVKASTTTVP